MEKPVWKDMPESQGSYVPKYNFAPTNFGPILVSASHFQEDDEETIEGERVLTPMKWGLVPSWTKSGSAAYSMINARAETLIEKNSYKTPLKKGRRCISVVDGFYEWAKEGKTKQSYFIHAPDVDDEGRPLLYMASLFDICQQHDQDPLSSYSVITVDSHKKIAFMHDRMPAILSTEEQIWSWLDYENTPLEEALELLEPSPQIEFYPVAQSVGNVKFQGPQCIEPIKLEKEKSSKKQSNIGTFFKPKREMKSETSSDDDIDGQPNAKSTKKEEYEDD